MKSVSTTGQIRIFAFILVICCQSGGWLLKSISRQVMEYRPGKQSIGYSFSTVFRVSFSVIGTLKMGFAIYNYCIVIVLIVVIEGFDP